MKRGIFLVCFFTVFLSLQIYAAIAAIFWQSASYVIFRYPKLIKDVFHFDQLLSTGLTENN